MLKIIRRYQRGVLGLFAIVFICLAMAGFGLDLLRGNNERPAITIDDTQISHQQYYRELRAVKNRYQQIFKGNFEQFARSLNLNLNQEVVEKMISDHLVNKEAERLGLAVGDQELTAYLRNNFPENGMYAAFLRSEGFTSVEFENQSRKDLLRARFAGLLEDVSFATDREIRQAIVDQQTAFDVQTVDFKPETFVAAMAPRSDDDLKRYFEENSTDFEIPAAVSYDYALISSDAFLGDVQITDEDIALYLSEHEQEYSTPEEVDARHILFLYPKESDPEKMVAVKIRAEEALNKARAGESFESLALEYSDDITTKSLGGELGTIQRGKEGKPFDDAVFSMKAPGVSDLISTDTGYRIVKVDAYRESKVKELSSVRGEIEGKIRRREAPAYAASRAREVFDVWQKDGKSLAEIVAPWHLKVQSTGLLDEKSDPDATHTGLTAKVMESGAEQRQLVELGDEVLFIAVKETREAALPSFDQVKPKIVEVFKKQDAVGAAKDAAGKFLAAVKEGKDFDVAVKEAKLKAETVTGASKAKGFAGVLAEDEVSKDLSAVDKTPAVLGSVYESGGAFYVVRAIKMVIPSESEIASKVGEFRTQEATNIQRVLFTSIVNRMKKKATIDFDQNLLAG